MFLRSTRRWALVAGLMVAPPALADEALRVIDTGPVADGTEQGRSDRFFVRFNQPVDHIRSELVIKQGVRTVEVLHPRFEAQPDELFARCAPLPAGDYTLAWTVRSLDGRVVAVGEIPFTSKAVSSRGR